MSIAAIAAVNNWAADKDPPFRPAAAAGEMAHHQTNDKLTVGAEAYVAGDKLKAAFGKLSPYQYGVLPVLVVFQNDTGATVRVNNMTAEYILPDGDHVEASPADEIRFAKEPKKPVLMPIPLPKGKNPLNEWQIEGHALAVEAITPGNQAFGFLYFRAPLRQGGRLYLSGIVNAATGKELLYFEIPLQ